MFSDLSSGKVRIRKELKMQLKNIILHSLIVISFCAVVLLLLYTYHTYEYESTGKNNSSYQTKPAMVTRFSEPIELVKPPKIVEENDIVNCGKKFEGTGMVFGGKKTTQNAWPWLVALIYMPKKRLFCGGSIISKRHVLTGEKICNEND